MAFITNAGSLATRKRVLAGKTATEFRVAAQLQATEMKRIAVEESCGTLDEAQLIRRGHPYSRRFPVNSAGQPDSLINAQSGDFKRSWKTRVSRSGSRWLITLYNTSQHAKYLIGTKSMRNRPITEQVMKRMKPIWPKPVRKVILRSIAANNASFAPLPAAPIDSGSSSLSLPGAVSGAGGGMSQGAGILFAVSAGLSSAGSAISGAVSEL